jgi:hypothetical protein
MNKFALKKRAINRRNGPSKSVKCHRETEIKRKLVMSMNKVLCKDDIKCVLHMKMATPEVSRVFLIAVDIITIIRLSSHQQSDGMMGWGGFFNGNLYRAETSRAKVGCNSSRRDIKSCRIP